MIIIIFFRAGASLAALVESGDGFADQLVQVVDESGGVGRRNGYTE